MDAIETAHLMERDELIKGQRGEIESLFEKRRQKELAYMKAKQEREEEYQREIEELLVQDAEEYNKLKIKLETEIQVQVRSLPLPTYRRPLCTHKPTVTLIMRLHTNARMA
jgi:dynein regulatry complex protein 1